MKITGELLKTERISKSLSVQQVAQSLKLSSKIINAIEAGDLSQLPAKTFVRGFVKSYAEYLKLDPDLVMRQFQEEMGSTSPLPKVPPPTPEQAEQFKTKKPELRQTSQNYSQAKSVTAAAIKKQSLTEENINNKIILFLFIAVGLVIVLVLGAKLFESDSATQPLTVNTNSDTNVIIPTFDSTIDPNTLNASASATLSSANNSASSSIQTATGSTAAELPNGQASATAISSATGLTVPVASNVNANTNTISSPVASEEDMKPSSGKPIEVILEAKKNTEISYAKGNTQIFKTIKLEANKIQVIRSNTGLHLKAADGGLIKITVNGIDIGNAGPSNKPVKLSF